MLIYIIRHGETDANLEGRLQGWNNNPLNESGIRLAKIVGQNMKDIKFDKCISSPLIRAKDTARLLLEESGNDIPIETDERIKEISMGEWEDRDFVSLKEEVGEEGLKPFFEDPFDFPGCPGGETIKTVCERTQEFLKELIKKDDDKTYLIATHGCALRAMLNFLYDDPTDFWHGHVPYNCVVNVVEAKDGVGKIIADDKLFYDPKDAVDRYSEV